jgi:hypothetical protein
LKSVRVFLEFVFILPHLYTSLLGRICRIVVCDCGSLDFLVWLVVTLDGPWLLPSVINRLLLDLVSRGNVVYLYADLHTLVKKADIPKGFIAKELAIYGVLAKIPY